MNAPDLLLCAPRQHLPLGDEFLFLPPWVQPYAYRIVDRLFAHRVIRRGPAPRPLPYGPEIDPRYTASGREYDVGAFMDRNAIVGALVIHRGHVVLERYGLGLAEHDRWSTMSTVKSITAMLVGAAVQDGAIKSIDEPLTKYLPALAGSAYEGVSLRHVLTMSSGTRWSRTTPTAPRMLTATASHSPIACRAVC
jgi:CubicO group peptidase (beta-lactamase class C family)